MRILISGGAGFIGSHLAERFQADGHDVYGIDSYVTGSPSNWEAEFCDVTNWEALAKLNVYPDLIVHCAASYKDPHDWENDAHVNICGTINMIRLAQDNDAKLVYFQTALPPVSSYALSKIAGGRYIGWAGIDYLIFRLANIYGPRNLSGPIPAFFKRLSVGEPCTVVSTARDMLYVKDLVAAVVKAIDEGRSGWYDICSGKEAAIAQLYDLVARYFPEAPIVESVPPTEDDVPTELNPERGVPGWQPYTSLDDGIAEAVRWYREHPVGETYTHLQLEEEPSTPRPS